MRFMPEWRWRGAMLGGHGLNVGVITGDPHVGGAYTRLVQGPFMSVSELCGGGVAWDLDGNE